MFHLFLDYPDLSFRYVVMPTAKLNQTSYYPYNFTQAEIKSFINQGIKDG